MTTDHSVSREQLEDWLAEIKSNDNCGDVYLTVYRHTFEFAYFHGGKVYHYLKWFNDPGTFSDLVNWYERKTKLKKEGDA